MQWCQTVTFESVQCHPRLIFEHIDNRNILDFIKETHLYQSTNYLTINGLYEQIHRLSNYKQIV